MKILNKQEESGSMAVLTRIRAGCQIPAHWHSKADETVYVLDGDFIEGETTYGPGTFFAGAAGTPHGPHSSERGCLLLTHFSAELDFHMVEVP